MSLTISRQYKHTKKLNPTALLPDDAVHLMANIAIKQRAAKFSQLLWLVSRQIPSEYVKSTIPLATFNKRDPSRIITFPNVPMAYASVLLSAPKNPYSIIFSTKTAAIAPFREYFNSELADPKKALKWQSTPRAFKTINKKQTLSMDRWLRSILMSSEHYYSDASIRDIATHIVSALRPADFHVAETPDDFMFMYENGPRSCMLSRTDGAGSWAKIMQEAKLHPTSFYAFCPEIIGAFVQQDKKVVARTLLYKVGDTVRYYGRIFSATGEHGETLRREILSHYPDVIKSQLRDDEFSLSKAFEIPIVKYGHTEYCPIPYTDNIAINLLFKRVDETRMGVYPSSTISGKLDETYVAFDTRNASGFIPVSHLHRCKCSNCGNVVSGQRVIRYADFAWCSEKCMAAMNYIRAFNAAGQRVVRYKEHCVVDPFVAGYAYTTRNAAFKTGAKPYITDLKQLLDTEYTDHPVWTMSGTTPLLYKKRYYVMPHDWIGQYVRDKATGCYRTKCGRFIISPSSGSWALTDAVDQTTMELKKNMELPKEEDPPQVLKLTDIFDDVRVPF